MDYQFDSSTGQSVVSIICPADTADVMYQDSGKLRLKFKHTLQPISLNQKQYFQNKNSQSTLP